MPPFPLLKKLQLIEGKKSLLDVGTKDGQAIQPFIQAGLDVTAIDINPLAQSIEKLHFEQISIEDFLTKNFQRYDIVIARHILPFTQNPLELIEKLSSIAGVFMFTCFGPQDDWHTRADVVTLEKESISTLFLPAQIRHYSETFEHSGTYSGNIKYWHIHTFVVDNQA